MRLNEKLTNWVVSLLAVVMLTFALGCGGGGGEGGGTPSSGYTISGKATADSIDLSGIEVILSVDSNSDTSFYSTLTDSSGNYSFSNLDNGDYEISAAPIPGNYSFHPVKRSVTVSSADAHGINFSGYLPTETITQTIGTTGGTISTPDGAIATFDPNFLSSTGLITISSYPSDLMQLEGTAPLSNVVEITIPIDVLGSTFQAKTTVHKSGTLEEEDYIFITIPTASSVTGSQTKVSAFDITDWTPVRVLISCGTEAFEGAAMLLVNTEQKIVKIAKSTIEAVKDVANFAYITIKAIVESQISEEHVPSALYRVTGYETASKTLRTDDIVWTETQLYQPYSGNKKIVILIHGWQGGNKIYLTDDKSIYHPEKDEGWYYFGKYFFNDASLANNFDLFTFRYDTDEDIPNNGSKFASAVNAVFQSDRQIYLIGHSMGGLVSHACLEGEPWLAGNKIKKLITLDTPFHGTPLIQLGYQPEVSGIPIVVLLPGLRTLGSRQLAWDGFDGNFINNWLTPPTRYPVSGNDGLYRPFAGKFNLAQSLSHSWYSVSYPMLCLSGYPDNDGVVPVISSYFKKDPQNPNSPLVDEVSPIFEDYDHSQIRTSKEGSTTAVFDKIKEILLPTSTNPQFKVIDQFNNPVLGVYVILHNSDGSVGKYATTNASGLADLGEISSDPVTMTIAYQRPNYYIVWSFVNISLLRDRPNTWRVWNDNPDKLGTINIEIPGYSSNVWLSPFNQEWSSSSKSVDVHVGEKQTDGKLSIGAAYPWWLPVKYGFLTDQTYQNGGTYTVNLNKDFGQISFTSNIPITYVDMDVFRKGLNFGIGSQSFGSPVSSGSFEIADQVPADTYIILADNYTYDSTSGKLWEKKFTTLLNPLSINMPNLSIDSATINGNGTVSWTVSGSAEKDITYVRFEWLNYSNYDYVYWYVHMDPSNSEWTHNLELPPEVSLWFQDKGLNQIDVRIEGYDSCSGFDNLIRKFLENPNNFSYNERYYAWREIWESVGVQSLSKQAPAKNGQPLKGLAPREKRRGFLP